MNCPIRRLRSVLVKNSSASYQREHRQTRDYYDITADVDPADALRAQKNMLESKEPAARQAFVRTQSTFNDGIDFLVEKGMINRNEAEMSRNALRIDLALLKHQHEERVRTIIRQGALDAHQLQEPVAGGEHVGAPSALKRSRGELTAEEEAHSNVAQAEGQAHVNAAEAPDVEGAVKDALKHRRI